MENPLATPVRPSGVMTGKNRPLWPIGGVQVAVIPGAPARYRETLD
jgi:hypothetical protein